MTEEIKRRLNEYHANMIIRGIEPLVNYYEFEDKEDYLNIFLIETEVYLPYNFLIIPDFIRIVGAKTYLSKPSGALKRLIFEGESYIESSAFFKMTELEELLFKDSTTLLSLSFYECTSLRSVTFNGKYVDIRNKVFSMSNGLRLNFKCKELYIKGSQFLGTNSIMDLTEVENMYISGYGNKFTIDESEFRIIVSDKNKDSILNTFRKHDFYMIEEEKNVYNVI